VNLIVSQKVLDNTFSLAFDIFLSKFRIPVRMLRSRPGKKSVYVRLMAPVSSMNTL
jgi:hypothetical protein